MDEIFSNESINSFREEHFEAKNDEFAGYLVSLALIENSPKYEKIYDRMRLNSAKSILENIIKRINDGEGIEQVYLEYLAFCLYELLDGKDAIKAFRLHKPRGRQKSYSDTPMAIDVHEYIEAGNGVIESIKQVAEKHNKSYETVRKAYYDLVNMGKTMK